MALLSTTLFRNVEQSQNRETVNLSAILGDAKRVILFDSNGNEVIASSGGSTIVSGTTTVTTAGTAVRITATPTSIKGVWLSGDTVAGFLLYVGDSSVVANVTGQRGICVIPGNNPVFLAITDLSLLWVDSASNGGKLSWLTVA